LITWYSKRQPTIESSVFGAEFVALKNGMELVRGLRYKLRMMGVDISGPTHLWRQYVCDSQQSKAGFNIEEEVEFHMLPCVS
jgi:hypothetical protein